MFISSTSYRQSQYCLVYHNCWDSFVSLTSFMELTGGLLSILLLPTLAQAILYPYDTPSRDTKSLDGFWTFKPDPSGAGFDESWFLHPLSGDDLMLMPVPSSFNDIGTSSGLRELDRYFFQKSKIFLILFVE